MTTLNFNALDEDEVAACPTCDSSQVRFYTPGGIRGFGTHPRYACRTCGDRFDTFVVRERKISSTGPSGLARDLLDADPDEVSR